MTNDQKAIDAAARALDHAYDAFEGSDMPNVTHLARACVSAYLEALEGYVLVPVEGLNEVVGTLSAIRADEETDPHYAEFALTEIRRINGWTAARPQIEGE